VTREHDDLHDEPWPHLRPQRTTTQKGNSMSKQKQSKQAQPIGLTDLQKMNSRNDWPRWPWLPMKRIMSDGSLQCSLLHADSDATKPAYLYLVNLFEVRSYFPTSDMPTTREYVDFQAMLDDGWKVD